MAILSVLVVRISLLEYSKIHENQVYSFFVSLEAFKMYYVMRASAPSLHRESTDYIIQNHLAAKLDTKIIILYNITSFLYVQAV